MQPVGNYKSLIENPLFSDGHVVLFLWENIAGWPVEAVSDNIQTLYGYKPSQYTSQKLSYADQIHPDDLQRVFQEVQEASSGDTTNITHEPYRYLDAQGLYRWVQDSTTILRDQTGNITHYVGYITDITNLIDTQELLKEKEHRFQELFEIAPVGIALNKMDGSFEELNETLYEMCGYSKEEFVNLSYWDITPKKYEKQEAKQIELLTKYGKYGPYFKEYIHKDGHHFPVLLNGIISKDRHGENHIWSIIQNMSEQVRINEEMEVNRRKLESVFSSSNDPIFIVKESKFVECNPSFYKALGYSIDSFKERFPKGASPLNISPEYQANGTRSVDEIPKHIQNVFAGKPMVFEWQHEKNDGSLLDVEVSLSLLEEGSETIIGSWRDISQRKLEEKLLKEAKEKAERANRAKSNFLANVSHEIRTPMNAILGFVDILSKGEEDPVKRDQFNHIRSSGKSLSTIINDTLDFSKIENNKLTIEKHSFNAKEPFENAVKIYKQNAEEIGIMFESSIDDSLSGSVIGDMVRIKQVVFNLLSNAIKFTQEGGKVNLSVSFDKKSEMLTCRVKDTGKGISPQNLSKIFQPFEQEDESTTRKFGGTGLGLAISSSLIEIMGGKLKVESKLHMGSDFYFTMPLEVANDSIQENDKKALPSQFDGHILVVEDNKTNQALLKIYLMEMGLSFEIANDGLEGVEAFKKGGFDLILMDENMPNMNGIEATKQILELERQQGLKSTPIIAVTANALHGDRERFLAAGMRDYMSKPFDDEDLKRIFHTYL
jgi:PAS domain S-box-containing protein